MISRLWNLDSDYDTLVSWWKDWNFGVVPLEVLPSLGIIIEDEGIPICAAGLYTSVDTKFSFMEWLVKDKNAPLLKSHKAVKLCIDEISELAKNKGCTLMFTVTSDDALMKRYTKHHKMKLMENNVRTFLKDLNNEYDYLEWIQDEEQWNKSQKVEA